MTARAILEDAKEAGCEIALPSDLAVARELTAGADAYEVDIYSCPVDAMILDAGPKSVADICKRFESARTVVWTARWAP